MGIFVANYLKKCFKPSKMTATTHSDPHHSSPTAKTKIGENPISPKQAQPPQSFDRPGPAQRRLQKAKQLLRGGPHQST